MVRAPGDWKVPEQLAVPLADSRTREHTTVVPLVKVTVPVGAGRLCRGAPQPRWP